MKLITGISELVTNSDPTELMARPSLGAGDLHTLTDAALIIDDGKVAWSGPAAEADAALNSLTLAAPDAPVETIDLGGKAVIPGFVDSHNHLVFAGDRSAEFAARMAGEKYSAGGIATTVAATRAATDEELEANLVHLVDQATRQGTTTFEIKSGYGLTRDDEIRALEIIGRHTPESTLIAAHVVPPEYKADPEAYVALVIDEIIPAAVGKAKWIDVFCEEGAFDEDQTRRVIEAGKAVGMKARLHANQLTQGGALRLGAALGCTSVDHATFASDEDLAVLAEAGTVVTLLPGVEFSTRQPYPDARRYLAAGVRLAIASDCNPGSCFTNSLPFCIAVAVRDMHFTVDQAVWAATAGGAHALDRSDVGHLGAGARADLVVLDAPSYRHLAYRPGVQLVDRVFAGGELVADNRAQH
ncbi:imidazolonepropionase [Brevibacterium casei]|uniref:imidazolonepropionase n=1 Tax=Brevibacterium casei TaxID=33889 RepID=UPI00186B9B7E|nr:imidazolonepropionase [Brevibacterium casei]MBE4694321.1 imidazolonepropionase [Brevibacterium casei]MBY3577443.1 imidazolonepropionase [Brevibacterium casei]